MEPFARVGTEVRLATRGLARARGFTAPALFALAIGMGGGAALLALVDTGLTHPAPVEALNGVPVPGSRDGADSQIRFSALDRLLGAGRGLQDAAMPIEELQAESLRQLLQTLAAVAGLTLAVAAVNLSLLLLMRGSGRRREFSVRAALGGTRRDVLRHLAAEGAVLGVAGMVLGLIVAAGGVRLLRGFWAPGLEPWIAGAVPVRAGGMAAAVLVLTALVGSLAPPARFGMRPLQPDLAAGDRSTADPRAVRTRRRLGAAAVAGSVVLLVGAGVLLRGFSPAAAGADRLPYTSDTLTLHLGGFGAEGAASETAAAEMEALLSAITTLPGVTAGAAASPGTWFGLGTRDLAHALLDVPENPGIMLPASFHSVSPGYFTAMATPMIDGRDLGPRDRPGAPGAMVVNATFVRRLLLGLDPIGKRVQLGGASLSGEFYTIVGVVPDVRLPGLGMPPTPQPAVYLSALQVPTPDLALAIRTSGDPMSVLPAVEAAVREIRPATPTTGAMTMEDRMNRFAAPIRWFGGLFAAAAAIAALLAARGLHGVIAYSVRQRRREIGVRVALGATPAAIVRLILREGARLTATGAVIGLAGALCLARLLEYLFQGVDALDPLVYLSVAVLLVLVTISAGVGPALAAARLQPVAALREE